MRQREQHVVKMAGLHREEQLRGRVVKLRATEFRVGGQVCPPGGLEQIARDAGKTRGR